jgi:hypothetical protein
MFEEFEICEPGTKIFILRMDSVLLKDIRK